MLVRILILIIAFDLTFSAHFYEKFGAISKHETGFEHEDDDYDEESAFESNATDVYKNYVDLVPGIYRLYWNLTKSANGNINSSELIGELHCRTQGWMGFGFSPNGHMKYSDVVIGWIQNGTANFTVNIKYALEYF